MRQQMVCIQQEGVVEALLKYCVCVGTTVTFRLKGLNTSWYLNYRK